MLMVIGVGSFLLMNVIQPYEGGSAATMLAVVLWAIGVAAVLLWGCLALWGLFDRKGLRLTIAERLYVKEFFFLTVLSCALGLCNKYSAETFCRALPADYGS